MTADGPTPPARRAGARRLLSPVAQFMAMGSASGVVLLAAALLALAWANSPCASSYRALIEQHVVLPLGRWTLDQPVHFWVNDVLMVLFFFLVGLEIKREVVLGELAEPRRVLLPVLAALGGMIAPALIFLLIVGTGAEARGWGIPVATDIAFAVGALTLAGPRVPFGLRVTLLALAIVDDIGGIIVIAAFYATALQPWALGAVGGVLLLCFLLGRSGVWYLPVYIVLGASGWALMYASGVHPTILGVALGLLTPAHPRHPGRPEAAGEVSPLDRLVRALTPVVSFAVTPIFAFANAGIAIDPGTLGAALHAPVTLGVFFGLIAGKPLGILALSWVAVRLGARLPEGVGWAGILAMGVVAGIGFTVALFVAGLSYTDAVLLTDAKLGIICASLVAGVLGVLALRLVFRGAPGTR